MKTTITKRNLPRDKYLRAILFILLSLLGVYSCRLQAQTRGLKYLGFETSFGTRYFSLNSNIQALNKFRLGHEGGSLGIVLGNERIKSRIQVAGLLPVCA